jgi:5-methylcytosine-specific restriction endonuclease McrA
MNQRGALPIKVAATFLHIAIILKNAMLTIMKTDEMNKKKLHEQFLSWESRNPERSKAYQKEYHKKRREDNKEAINKKEREYAAKRRAENPEKEKAIALKYREKNQDKERERKAKWRIENQSIIKYHKIIRKKRSLIKPEDKNQIPIMNVIYKCCRRISDCTGIQFHVDHIIPLSRNGNHAANNLQILPAKINLRKSAKIIFDHILSAQPN